MKRNNALIKTLAVIGTVLVWLPVLAPLGMTRWGMLGREGFNFDWLIPAELSPIVAVGAALLLAAALLSHARRGMVGWGVGIAVGMLVTGMVLAQVTGLASGEAAPEGLPWMGLIGAMAGYVVGIVVMGVAGVLLLRDLFRRSESAAP